MSDFTTISVEEIGEVRILSSLLTKELLNKDLLNKRFIKMSCNGVQYAVSNQFFELCKNICEMVKEQDKDETVFLMCEGDFRCIEAIIYIVERSLSEKDPLLESKEEHPTISLKEWHTSFLKEYNPCETSALPLAMMQNMLLYLGVHPIACLVGYYIAENYIKGRTIEFIRLAFGQEDDMTPKEKEMREKDNSLLSPIE